MVSLKEKLLFREGKKVVHPQKGHGSSPHILSSFGSVTGFFWGVRARAASGGAGRAQEPSSFPTLEAISENFGAKDPKARGVHGSVGRRHGAAGGGRKWENDMGGRVKGFKPLFFFFKG